jgi:hypothetical protein
MRITRRGFLTAAVAVVAAPAIVRAESIMRIRPIQQLGPPYWWRDPRGERYERYSLAMPDSLSISADGETMYVGSTTMGVWCINVRTGERRQVFGPKPLDAYMARREFHRIG